VSDAKLPDPFEDGNGCTARALFYWCARIHGYWMIEYLSISKILRDAPARYSRAFLLTETDDGDATYFLLHQLETIKRAVDELHAYLRRKVSEIRDVQRLIKDAEGLNHRQLALLGDAIRDPDTSYTYVSHANSNRISHETARGDLLELRDLGLLRAHKRGRKHVYSAVENLPHALAELSSSHPRSADSLRRPESRAQRFAPTVQARLHRRPAHPQRLRCGRP
jgi:Fic family protein